MASNTWTKWTTGNPSVFKSLGTYTSSSNPPRSILEYSHNFFWNSDAKELHIRGGGATGSSPFSYRQRHLRYNDGLGTWDAVTPWHTSFAHQWGHFAGDPATGNLYYRARTTTDIYKWNYQAHPATVSSWPLDHSGSFNGGQNANALGFFPDLNNGVGGLVFFDTVGDDATISATTNAALNSWTTLRSGVFSPVTVEGILVYLPGQKWMLFGGGKGAYPGPNFKLGKVEADGSVSQLNDLPFLVGANVSGDIVAHPNGRVFGIDTNGMNLYEYNEGADSWSSAGLSSLPFSGVKMNAAVMIPEFNVIYVAAHLGTGGSDPVEHWLYKL